MTENERYDWDLNGIWDYNDESDEYIESYEDITKLLNEKEEEIQELKQTIDTIAKDYEESHGMDIRNAEWFTAW